MTMEYPKRLTAINDITGALIKSKPSNDTYESNLEKIFGKKPEREQVYVDTCYGNRNLACEGCEYCQKGE